MAIIGGDIYHAAEILKQGELVAIPTETVYGLAANALDERAVINIFAAKQRPAFDPLIVHIPDALSMQKYADHIPEIAWNLAETFWPGPLTLLLLKREIIPDIVTSGKRTVGLRMPAHSMTLALLNELDFPLAAPSANPFGYISPTTAQHVKDQLNEKISYILDGGPSKVGVESTIIGFKDNQAILYRPGGIAQEEIEKITGPLMLLTHQDIQPDSPGQLTSHYAPRKPLYIGNIEQLQERYGSASAGIIRFSGEASDGWVLSPTGDVDEAARHLFSVLREADNSSYKILLAEPAPDNGLGKAINDRLKRAAAK